MIAVESSHASLGQIVTSRLVRQMKTVEVRRDNRALQSIAYALDTSCAAAASKRNPELGLGVGAADLVKPGETLIVYADANLKAGYRMTSCTTATVAYEHAKAAALTSGQRHRRKIELAFALYPKASEHVPGADRQAELGVMQALLVEFAALTIDRSSLDQLGAICDGVPLLLIACRTNNRGGRAVSAHYHASRLPGVWLGTTPSAGQA